MNNLKDNTISINACYKLWVEWGNTSKIYFEEQKKGGVRKRVVVLDRALPSLFVGV